MHLADEEGDGGASDGIDDERRKQGWVDGEENARERDEIDEGREARERERERRRREVVDVCRQPLIRVVDHLPSVDVEEGAIGHVVAQHVAGHPLPPPQ